LGEALLDEGLVEIAVDAEGIGAADLADLVGKVRPGEERDLLGLAVVPDDTASTSALVAVAREGLSRLLGGTFLEPNLGLPGRGRRWRAQQVALRDLLSSTLSRR